MIGFDRLTIARGGALGDFLVTLPALRALRPLARCLHYVGNDSVARALATDLFESVISLDDERATHLFRTGPSDAGTGRGAFLAIWRDSSLTAAAIASGYRPAHHVAAHPPEGSEGTVANHVAREVDRLFGTSTNTAVATIRVDEWSREAASALLRSRGARGPFLLVHPGSGSPAKNWPIEHFAALAALVRRQGIATLWLAGPADVDTRWSALREDDIILPPLDLTTLAGVAVAARGFVGNDSGVAHLAAGVGVPSAIVYGPTRAARWLPAGPRVRAIEPTSRCASCAVSERAPASCACLMTIDVPMVLDAAQKMLEVAWHD